MSNTQKYTYDGDENEAYTIFKDNVPFAEMYTDEDVVIEIVDFLNFKF